MTELREKIALEVAEKTSVYTLGKNYHEQKKDAQDYLLSLGNSIADQIRNLLKEELDKLTMIGDEEFEKMFDLAYYQNQSYNAGMSEISCEPEDMMRKVAKAQLNHTIRQLKESLR